MKKEFLFRGCLEYEVVMDDYFRGSKERAKAALSETNVEPCSYENFIEYLEITFAKQFSSIELVRFYNYVDRYDNFHYKLAFLYTKPIEFAREVFFQERLKTTMDTGWYPYVTGRKAKIVDVSRYRKSNRESKFPQSITNNNWGKPINIKDVSKSEKANAFLLQCRHGNILFDTGFGVIDDCIPNIDQICITHFHKDHISGLIQILKKRDIPVLLSTITLEYILYLREFTDIEKQLIINNAVTIERVKFYDGLRAHLDFYPVFHAPGSVGYVYKFRDEIEVFFAGDICLKNGFYDFTPKLNTLLREGSFLKKYIFLDSAMVGKQSVIAGDDSPDEVIDIISNSIGKRNVVFICNNDETLAYSYLKLFYWSNMQKDMKIKLVINDELYNKIVFLWLPQLQKTTFRDLFIENVFCSRANFAESQRLYPLSSQKDLITLDQTIFFITPKDLAKDVKKEIPVEKSDVVLAGVWVLKNRMPIELSTRQPRSILRICSADWSFHTNETDLIMFLKSIAPPTQVLLSHNYANVLRKFINKNGFGDSISILEECKIE